MLDQETVTALPRPPSSREKLLADIAGLTAEIAGLSQDAARIHGIARTHLDSAWRCMQYAAEALHK